MLLLKICVNDSIMDAHDKLFVCLVEKYSYFINKEEQRAKQFEAKQIDEYIDNETLHSNKKSVH